VVSSLLRWQSRTTQDKQAVEALKESQSHVQSMSLIHQNLYQNENLTGISMRKYLENLIQNLVSTYQVGEGIDFKTEIEELTLDVDTVVPIGLIIYELTTNAIKYAFPDGGAGTITIHLKEVEDKLNLEVSDNGIGIKDTSSLGGRESFGYGLIQAFSQRLQAELLVNGENGTQVKMEISEWKKL